MARFSVSLAAPEELLFHLSLRGLKKEAGGNNQDSFVLSGGFATFALRLC
jgi:hypothetical protein